MKRNRFYALHALKKNILFLAAFMLAAFDPGYAQVCGNSYETTQGSPSAPPPGTAARPTPNTSCGRQSSAYINTFKPKEQFIPNGTIVTPSTVRKKVKVRFMISDPGTAVQKNFRHSEEAQLVSLLNTLNFYFQNTEAPTRPKAAICGSCHIPDTRIQLELVGVTYFPSTDTTIPHTDHYDAIKNKWSSSFTYSATDLSSKVVGGDTVLNIFFCYFNNGKYPDGTQKSPGYAGITNNLSNISKFEFYNSPNRDYIIMANVYQEPDRPAVARTLMHELFHEYGLWHLWDSTETCSETDPDFLADIFNTGAAKVCPQTWNYDSCTPSSPGYPYVTCDNNTMSPRGWTWTSPMQTGIIHRESYLGRMRRYTYPRDAPDVYPWYVLGSQVWDFPIRVYQDIRVTSGATLTIKCEVQMPPGSRIVVEPNGKLIIDGGLITSYDPKTSWKGIELIGDNNQPASPQYQGSVEIKNGAVIENAQEGLQNFADENGGWGGGIIKAANSTFYNCWRSVALNTYNNNVYTGLNCSFDGITFSVDDQSLLRYPNGVGDQFTAFDIKGGVIVRNCTFRNEISYTTQAQHLRSNAIYMVNTGVKINNNKFDAFRGGIYLTGHTGTPMRTARVYDNGFKHVSNNIVIAANAFADVQGNTITNILPFQISSWPLQFRMGTGIYLDNANGSYVACGNTINGINDGGPYSDLYKIGVLVNNSGAAGAVIKRNTFSGLYTGTQTQKDNPKLGIACNRYENNDVAWRINPGSPDAIYSLQQQGTGCGNAEYRAGNVFVNNTTSDINSYLVNPWYYYAFRSNTVLDQHPFNSSGNLTVSSCNFTTATSDPNSQCNNIWDCLRAFEVTDAQAAYSDLLAKGLKASMQASILRGGIVRAYNDAGNSAALRSFLLSENDNDARRMLIPLQIEMGQYSQALATVNQLTLPASEKTGYTNYYSIIANVRQQGRKLSALTGAELKTVRDLAAGNLEVKSFAQALLEFTYNQPWEHTIEPIPVVSLTNAAPVQESVTNPELSSVLYDAIPNPAYQKTEINVRVTAADARQYPELQVYNSLGHTMSKISLKEGDNKIVLNTSGYAAGIYLYNLSVNGKAIVYKKLSIIR